MVRILFNILAAISLVIALTLLVLWYRSYRIGTVVDLRTHGDSDSGTPHRWFELESAAGGLRLCYTQRPSAPAMTDDTLESQLTLRSFRDPTYPFEKNSARSAWGRAGVRFGDWVLNGPDCPYVGPGFVVPHWMPVILFSLLPVWWCFRVPTRTRRLRARLCVGCGYDLRGSLSGSGHECPECGHPMPNSRYFKAAPEPGTLGAAATPAPASAPAGELH
jgi:hypothetical protein